MDLKRDRNRMELGLCAQRELLCFRVLKSEKERDIRCLVLKEREILGLRGLERQRLGVTNLEREQHIWGFRERDREILEGSGLEREILGARDLERVKYKERDSGLGIQSQDIEWR